MANKNDEKQSESLLAYAARVAADPKTHSIRERTSFTPASGQYKIENSQITVNRSSKIYVIKHEKGWVIRREPSKNNERSFSTQNEAIKSARNIAKRERGEVVIYRPNGEIRDHNSYGTDTMPLKDKRSR